MPRIDRDPGPVARPDLTPSIDVVFLLLVFFVLSARFIADERHLDAPLPDRGTGLGGPPPATAEIRIDLQRRGDRTLATAATLGFGAPGSERARVFPGRFDTSDVGAFGFAGLSGYLRERSRQLGRSVPVTIHTADDVDVQAVVGVYDSCRRTGMRDVALGAPEAEIP